MPRGLGDNPLKREKKLHRSSSRARRSGPSAVATDQSPTLPAGVSGPVEAHASSTSTSYNDVFFHRRPEDAAPAVIPVPETTHEEARVEAPAEDHVETPVEVPVEAAPTPVTEIAPAEALHVPAPVPLETSQPVVPVPVESAPEHPIDTPPLAPVQNTAQALSAETEEKKGFFGRIFGKWKKS